MNNIENPQEPVFTEQEIEKIAMEAAEIVHLKGEQLKDEKAQRNNYINENYL